MAAKDYKIGDRVIVVPKWNRPMNDRFSRHLGQIRTIDSICERVFGHNQRDKFYRFVEAQEEGHFWDDCDIEGLAPMIPKKKFHIQVDQRVVLLPHDGSNNAVPGRITDIVFVQENGYFYVTQEYNKQTIRFRISDFVCNDPEQCSRMIVYESEDAMKADQVLFRFQKDMQYMCQRYMTKIPSVEDLISFAKLMGLWDESPQTDSSDATNKFEWDLFYPPEKQEKTMLIKYRHRVMHFDDGYFALATGDGNPCNAGCGVALRCDKKGGNFGWGTTDVIHICCFGNPYCAHDLAKALNTAKRAGKEFFDVDKWIQEKIDNDARPESLANKSKTDVQPFLGSYDD